MISGFADLMFWLPPSTNDKRELTTVLSILIAVMRTPTSSFRVMASSTVAFTQMLSEARSEHGDTAIMRVNNEICTFVWCGIC